MLVGQHLEFNVARVLDVLLHVEIAVAECARRFGLRGAIKSGEIVFVADDAHAAPAASGGGFNDDREADLPRPLHCLFGGGDYAIGAGENGHAMLLHGGARFFFFAHQADDIGSRPDELDVAGIAHFGEVRVFGKQAVAGMDGIDVGDFGGADYGGNVEVTQRQLGRADANGFVGKTHMERIPVGFAVDGHRADSQLLARADDAQRNFTAIGYQNLFEHKTKALRSQSQANIRANQHPIFLRPET